LADEEPQERGCNDCGYIACSQDCGMRNFDWLSVTLLTLSSN
jgi:hypothetical protein